MTDDRIVPIKERRNEGFSVDSYFTGSKRVYDAKERRYAIKLFSGDCYISHATSQELLCTVLGSCISACIRDPYANVGGMNHFLLPGEENAAGKISEGTRYGVFAMETLINGLLKAGGRRDRLEVKIFGGGNVTNNSARIGSQNARFIRDFITREKLNLLSEDLEGELPRRVHYYPDSGRVMIRKLVRKEDKAIADIEARYSQKTFTKPVEGDIDLF